MFAAAGGVGTSRFLPASPERNDKRKGLLAGTPTGVNITQESLWLSAGAKKTSTANSSEMS